MAHTFDIEIDQGATFRLRVRFTAPNFSTVGATGRGQLRKRFTDAAPAATFTVTTGTDVESFYIDAELSAADTAAIPTTATGTRKPEKFIYDFELVLADSTVIRVLEGVALVSPEATK